MRPPGDNISLPYRYNKHWLARYNGTLNMMAENLKIIQICAEQFSDEHPRR